ncbi:MBL fold metallo-hydrolase [Sorangium sp. So ce726]|uniref:MBL fold metallo-hydrolase n=1 Tax=Sorangium sp. So ce726 TaxID=3133319 RepID=UPI003F60A99C
MRDVSLDEAPSLTPPEPPIVPRRPSTFIRPWLRRIGAGLGAVVALGAALVIWAGLGSPSKLPRVELAVPPQRASAWEDVFARGQRVRLCTLETGEVGGARSMLLRSDHVAFDRAREHEPLPIYAHLVRHPARGDVLIDAGLSAPFERDPFGDIRAPVSWLHRAMGTRFTLPAGRSLGAQLARFGSRPRQVYLTHVHGDHTAGLGELPGDVEIVTGEHEADDLAGHLGYGHFAEGATLSELSFARGVPMPPFDLAIDVWGDGALWALPTPGHSRGHLSFVVNAESGPVLLVGDASHYAWAFERGIGPRGPSASDEAVGQRSLDRLRELVRAHPSLRVVYGHEAPQVICELSPTP